MAVTLQQIAEEAGVSRGTVDRALNNRGRIRPEVAEKIRKIANELGYQPSRAGRALSIAKKHLKIGVIAQRANTPFIKEVLTGLKAGKKEVESLGATVEIHTIDKVDASKVVGIMEDMRAREINGIVLSPTDDGYLQQMIDKFVQEYDIPILTFNSDLENSARFCFVGQNAAKSGQTAAGIMGEIINGTGLVMIISAHKENLALEKRAAGFIQELKHSYPDVKVLGVRYAYDDDWVAQKIVEDTLAEFPQLKGIYITGTGVKGVCEAVKKTCAEDMTRKAESLQSVKIIANDIIAENVAYLNDGTIKFLIGEDTHAQGYQSVMILFRKLLDKREPKNSMQYTDIIIKNKYNL